jgi:hypothetical protein
LEGGGCKYQAQIRDSSAVRRLFVRLVGAVGCQNALHKENSGFAAPTLLVVAFSFSCLDFFFL